MKWLVNFFSNESFNYVDICYFDILSVILGLIFFLDKLLDFWCGYFLVVEKCLGIDWWNVEKFYFLMDW